MSRRVSGETPQDCATRAADASISRREMLATCLATGLVLGDAMAAGGGPDCVDVDLSGVPPGSSVVVMWRGRRVFVRHRTNEEIRAARDATLDQLLDPQPDDARAKRPEWIVVFGECTHAGCKPIEGLGKYGGWLCLCHGSDFDTSGRIRRGPARQNLEIPQYSFTGRTTLRIGDPGLECGSS